jgi:hypothetical protein
MMILW